MRSKDELSLYLQGSQELDDILKYRLIVQIVLGLVDHYQIVFLAVEDE